MENRSKLVSILLIAAIVVGCYDEPSVSVDDIILDMGFSPVSIPADGVSRTLVYVNVPAEATDAAAGSITLTTTKGMFEIVAKNTATVPAQNIVGADGKLQKVASIYLVSPIDESEGYVTATVKNYSRTDTIQFARAFPDSIEVRVDKLVLKADVNAEILVTTQIKRNAGTGVPSIGQVIDLSAVDNSGNEIGVFRNKHLITDSNGNCINYFSLSLGDVYTGQIKFVAKIKRDANGALASDSVFINVIH